MKSYRETSEIDLDAIVERRNAFYLALVDRIASGCACPPEAMCDLCSAEAAASDNFFSHIEEDEGDLIREVERLRLRSARFVPCSGLCTFTDPHAQTSSIDLRAVYHRSPGVDLAEREG